MLIFLRYNKRKSILKQNKLWCFRRNFLFRPVWNTQKARKGCVNDSKRGSSVWSHTHYSGIFYYINMTRTSFCTAHIFYFFHFRFCSFLIDMGFEYSSNLLNYSCFFHEISRSCVLLTNFWDDEAFKTKNRKYAPCKIDIRIDL